MNVQEIITGGGAFLVLMTLVQITPIKINPWSYIGGLFKRAVLSIGRAMNGDMMTKMESIESKILDFERRFVEHERARSKADADERRADILRFNREVIRELPHTMEDFIEVLSYIDFYENYCEEHPEYENNRAVAAIQNIKRAYQEHLERNDFS